MTRFKERVVLITGAGSGIGKTMAEHFDAEGARVAVVDWNQEAAGSVAASLRHGHAVRADVSSRADVSRMVAHVEAELGAVDVLVNNAAVCEGDDLLQIEEPTWDRDVDVVLKAVYLCIRAVLPSMLSRKTGVIVNIASVNGLAAFGNEAYSAAKAGVVNLTQSVAVRYGGEGIRCNAIAPGSIQTPIWGDRVDRDPAIWDRIVKWYPLGRVGRPEDVARAALFLASDDASWITGTTLRVDGGLTAGNQPMIRELMAMAASEPPGS